MRTSVPEKLLKVVDEIDEQGHASLTRLTVLKKWFEEENKGSGVFSATKTTILPFYSMRAGQRVSHCARPTRGVRFRSFQRHIASRNGLCLPCPLRAISSVSRLARE
jgi:hypothetical protein